MPGLPSACGSAHGRNVQLSAAEQDGQAAAHDIGSACSLLHSRGPAAINDQAAPIPTAKCVRQPPEHCNNIWCLLHALQDLQELVSHCLQKEPAERWTARQLLKHRFWKVHMWAAASTPTRILRPLIASCPPATFTWYTAAGFAVQLHCWWSPTGLADVAEFAVAPCGTHCEGGPAAAAAQICWQ